MIRRFISAAAPTLFAAAIGITGFCLLCNWAVCEQDDSLCAFTGVSK